MEVFMRNLPGQGYLSDQQLRELLSPFLTRLGIDEWDCQKHKKKTTGSIFFTTTTDCDTFLRHHGKEPLLGCDGRPRIGKGGRQSDKARLRLLNTEVYCEKGKKDLGGIVIKMIASRTEKKKKQDEWAMRQAQQGRSHAMMKSPVVFGIWELHCGHVEYLNGLCHFLPDVSWPQREPSSYRHDEEAPTAKFAKSHVILKLNGGFRIDIAFNCIHELIITERDCSLTFVLVEAPRFYQETDQNLSAFEALFISPSEIELPPRTRLTSIGAGAHSNVIGAALVYRLRTHPSEFAENIHKLHSRPFITATTTNSYVPILSTGLSHGFQSLDVSLAAFNNRIVSEATEAKLPFDVLFQLQALVWNGYLLPGTVHTVLEAVKARVGRADAISSTAIKRLFRDIPYPGPNTPSEDLDAKSTIDWLRDVQKKVDQEGLLPFETLQENKDLVWIYKALVTPTHVMLIGPEMETRNRVLRRYPDHTTYFVRVQFGEENGTPLAFNPKIGNGPVYQRFKSLLVNGIMIGGRRYTFFGFSHSSLRNHSAWFLAPFFHKGTLCSYISIIKELGDFSRIHVIARCAARIGQAFSETPYAVNMEESGISHVYIEDLKSPDGSRVFSDGVGTLSPDALTSILERLPPVRYTPTAFQIRFGGSKGMLSLDPSLRGNGKIICIRKGSMEKFESNAIQDLEICDMGSRPTRMVLGRQIIKILEDMGVDPDWFLKLQKMELDQLRGVTRTVTNASIFLTQQFIGDGIEFPKFLRRLSSLGIDYRTDRLLCSIVEASVLHELRLLKHKARIPVPLGVTLFGVVDESGFLEEGEVYVTFISLEGLFERCPEDDVRLFVTKSPAMHPGDIQVAVNKVPPDGHALKELRNCIVFSQKGSRDLPSMLSGGDLDGDRYHVIWDPSVFPERHKLTVYTPADYSRPRMKDTVHEVTQEDIARFFVDFMETDQLGVICNRHVILADQKSEGTVHPDCKLLSNLASTAVDFSKTGISPDVGLLREVIKKMHPARPDFMADGPQVEVADRSEFVFEDAEPIPENDEDEDLGAQHEYYRSDKILGQLFRRVDDKNIWDEEVRVELKRHPIMMWKRLREEIEAASQEFNLSWTHTEEKAWQIRNFYDEAVQNAMADNAEHPHKPLSEVELFIGKVFNSRGKQQRREWERSEKLRSVYDRISTSVWKIIRERSLDDSGSVVGSNIADTSRAGTKTTRAGGAKNVLELALACFHVSLSERGHDVGRRYERGWKVETFKILAANVLLKELDMYKKTCEAQSGEQGTSGRYVGVGRGRRPARGGRRGGLALNMNKVANAEELSGCC